LPRRKTRTRPSELAAAATAALILSGCGGGEKRAAPQPKLPRDVAAELAVRSDRVAAALGDGDDCAALGEARLLQQETIVAINARRVPAVFQEHLGSTVADLVARIECVPAQSSEDDGRGKHKEKKKDKKRGKDTHDGDDD
jgi:hypothetical protein